MSSSPFVKLNIGGTVFHTRPSTLKKYDCMFRTMLDTDIPVEKDDDGCFFIDRDPRHFHLLLNFMRDGEVDLPNSRKAVAEIQREAKYYLLEDLEKLCDQRLKTKAMENIVKLNVGGTVFATSRRTLAKYDCMFRTMLDTDIPVEKDDDGCFFIDRDPCHFHVILNFMRDGEVDLPNSRKAVAEIQREAKYYLLEDLEKLCEEPIGFLNKTN